MNKVAKLIARMKSVPLDIEGLFNDLGIGYEKSFDLDDHISGEIERMDDRAYADAHELVNDRFVVRTNANHSNYHQRFTAAHELGHYMLHYILVGRGVDDNRSYRSSLKNGNFKNKNIKKRHETEANRFAATILMPSALVKQEFTKCPNLNQLARLFLVSEQVMAIRLKSLDLK